MIQSMTGYGKAEAMLQEGKLIIEIRTLNGKTADVNLKSPLIPKDKELEVRSRISSRLIRGTIDVFLTWEPNLAESSRKINFDIARGYISQVKALADEAGASLDMSSNDGPVILNAILRLPDVTDNGKKADVINDDNWPKVSEAIDRCLDAVCDYRNKEGLSLYDDVTSRIAKIQDLYDGIEALATERIEGVKARILKAAAELEIKLDKERFEQEMIYYLEKYDINEEKVRLHQHCKYFLDTINAESCPGKKLGFILQEMGREINTTGSKANHAGIQKIVVKMKDELEKVREQSMNIL